MKNELPEIQRWMQKVILEQNAFTDQEVNPHDMVISTSKLSAVQRLEIYQTSYWLRLVDCLASMYPALELFTGKELFRMFAKDYLQAHPPTSYTLSVLGENFPDFLKQTKPAGIDSTWSELIIELAEFECSFGRIYDSAGSEKLPLLTAKELLALSPEKLLSYSLKPVPNVLLSAFKYPIKSIFNRLRSKEKIQFESLKPSKTFYCIFRHQYRVQVIELHEEHFNILQDIHQKRTLKQVFSTSGITDKNNFLSTIIHFAEIGLFLA